MVGAFLVTGGAFIATDALGCLSPAADASWRQPAEALHALHAAYLRTIQGHLRRRPGATSQCTPHCGAVTSKFAWASALGGGDTSFGEGNTSRTPKFPLWSVAGAQCRQAKLKGHWQEDDAHPKTGPQWQNHRASLLRAIQSYSHRCSRTVLPQGHKE